MTITNSTLSGNRSTGWHGGAIFQTDGNITITNSTIANNIGPDWAPSTLFIGQFGGSFVPTLTLTNTIITGNQWYACEKFASGTVGNVVSGGNNLVQDDSCNPGASDPWGDLPAVILRPGFIYGERDRTVLPKLIDALRKRRFVFFGSGEQAMNCIYVKNLVHAMFLATEAPDALGEVFNLTDGEAVSKRRFVNRVADLAGLPRPTKQIPRGLARVLANVVQAIAKARGATRPPLINKARYKFIGLHLDYSIDKARRVLGQVAHLDAAQRPAVGRAGVFEVGPGLGQGDVQARLPGLDPAEDELQGDGRLARPGVGLEEVEALPQEPALEDVVEAGHPGRDVLACRAARGAHRVSFGDLRRAARQGLR